MTDWSIQAPAGELHTTEYCMPPQVRQQYLTKHDDRAGQNTCAAEVFARRASCHVSRDLGR
jgi:hypothetical protein